MNSQKIREKPTYQRGLPFATIIVDGDIIRKDQTSSSTTIVEKKKASISPERLAKLESHFCDKRYKQWAQWNEENNIIERPE